MQESPTQRLLQYAAGRLGQEELAKRLKATEQDVLQWMEGRAEMPPRKAIALADLIEYLKPA